MRRVSAIILIFSLVFTGAAVATGIDVIVLSDVHLFTLTGEVHTDSLQASSW